MSVKDLVKELTDENQVRVEKVGSNNWYWAWMGEEKAEKRKMVSQLEQELAKIQGSNQELRAQAAQVREKLESWANDNLHQERLRQRIPLQVEVGKLAGEKDAFLDSASGRVDNMLAEAENSKSEVTNLTDAIHILDDFLVDAFDGDREIMQTIRSEAYGSFWVDDEGLVDLEEV